MDKEIIEYSRQGDNYWKRKLIETSLTSKVPGSANYKGPCSFSELKNIKSIAEDINTYS